MTPAQFGFFRRYLRGIAESFFEDGVISSNLGDALQSFPNTPQGILCASELFSRRVVNVPEYRLRMRLRGLREIDGSRLDHIQLMFTGKRRQRRRVCFVGYRFVPEVRRTLVWNLRQILEPYNVQLDWSGRDIRSVQIFDDIVRRIRRADFCIFDNRATSGRPNVYIEAGIAYAVRTPFVLFEFARQRSAVIPSDLSHCFAIRYTSYRRLFQEFYAKLPVFLDENFRKER